MQLLSPKKLKQVEGLEADEKRIASIRLARRKAEEQKKYAESVEDWDEEKKKAWEAFSKWNQEIQQKKAKLLLEIEKLEKKRESLIDTIKVHL